MTASSFTMTVSDSRMTFSDSRMTVRGCKVTLEGSRVTVAPLTASRFALACLGYLSKPFASLKP